MSTIKDLYDLFEKLYNSTKDKQILELLLPIKEKILDTEKDNLNLQKENLHLHKTYQEEVAKLLIKLDNVPKSW